MGCGGSTQPGPAVTDDQPSSESSIEKFSSSPGRESPKNAGEDPTSKRSREETIKQREDNVRVPESPSFNSPSSVSGRFQSQESMLPDPFLQSREQQQQQRSPGFSSSPPGDMRGGYIKENDTRKRGGFDPEKFRQANGRGGGQLSSSLGVGMQQQQQPQADFSANSFNRSNNDGGGGRLGQGMPRGSQSMSFGGEYASDQSQQMWNQPPQQQQQQFSQPPPQQFSQQNYIPNPDFSSNPKMLDMNSGTNSMVSPGMSTGMGGSMQGQAGKPNYGALGWESSQPNSIGSPNDSSMPSPPPGHDTNLNRTDEQELDDILQELGDV